MNRQQRRRITAEIQNVLYDVWDPIGVNVAPGWPRDEYDCCADPLLSLLMNGASDDALAEYLWRQATEHMGLTRTRGLESATVAALRKIMASHR